MTPSEEIMQFLKDNPTFYLATVDGYLPRVRPLGFAMWYKDHLCLGIGKHKAAYKQLLDNTNLEICACNEKGEFLRVQGTANFDNTPEAQAAAFKIMPQLADMYNEETGLKLGIIYLDHLSAKLFSMSGSVKGHHGLLSDKQNKSKTNARAFRLWGAHGRFILRQYRIILSADTASEVRQMPSQKRR